MGSRFAFNKRISIALICSMLVFGVSGCSPYDIADIFEDSSELAKKLHESPRFWEDATKYQDSTNLYKVHNVAFEGKPYNDIAAIGDNLLLIGQGSYFNVDDMAEENSDTDYKYSFDVYSPWSNTITASLEHDDIKCDSYTVLADELFLFNDDEKSVTIYDSQLNLKDTFDISSLYELSDMKFYSGLDNSVFYTYDTVHDCILSISRDSFDYVAHPLNLYDFNIHAISPDGKSLLISGVDKSTLQNSVEVISTTSFVSNTVLPGDIYGSNSISNSGFFAQTSYTNNYWVYHQKDGDDSYYTIEGIWNSKIIDDGSVIFLQNDSASDTTDKFVTKFTQLDPDTGKILSSNSYSYGQISETDFDLLSNNYVYLKDCNSVMFLTYTQSCMPELLVWKLDNDTNENYDSLTRFSSEEEMSIASPLGNTITMIPDSYEYGWGQLEDLNNQASELEDKYSIEIFMGEEVPETIDCFNLKRTTDYDTIQDGLDTLEHILSCYPEDFFTQLCYGDNRGIRIYLSAEISADSEDMIDEASGFVSNINSYVVMVLDLTYSWDWGYTVNHEISHMIDRRLDFYSIYEENCLFSEKKWSSYNPDDFTYLERYTDYEDNPDYYKYSNYFIDAYGTTFSTEDRAEIFGRIMDDVLNSGQPGEEFSQGTPYYNKIDYYARCIRDGFQTYNWPKKLPWELN